MLRHSRRLVLKTLAASGMYFGMAPATSLLASNQKMQQRAIPSSGEKIGVVGVGTWQTFDVNDNSQALQPLREVLQILVEQGGNVIDSSPMYGRSEQVSGNLAASLGIQDQLFYATKVWTRGREEGIRQMEESMKKMQAKPMDLMQIHNLVDWQTQLQTLKAWKAEGILRYIGITHYTTTAFDAMSSIMQDEDIDFVQLPYSIVTRQAEESLLPLARDRGIAVIVNQPYESGSLFSATKGKSLPGWATDFDCQSWGQFFLKFILSHPAVTCVIPGTDNPKHMRDNAGAGIGSMPDQDTRDKMARLIKDTM